MDTCLIMIGFSVQLCSYIRAHHFKMSQSSGESAVRPLRAALSTLNNNDAAVLEEVNVATGGLYLELKHQDSSRKDADCEMLFKFPRQ